MQLFIKDKAFYRSLFAIAIPIAGQNLINFGVSMADTVMIGMLGDVELSAGAIASNVGFVFMLLMFGLGSGSNVMIAQYWGKKDIDSIHRVITVMYRALFGGALFFTCVALFLPNQIMSIFTTNQEVIRLGSEYLRIIGYSYLITGVTSATVILLRAVAAVKISLVIYISSLVTNVILNYCLIFGKFGFPQMGVGGAALATCIARVVEIIILLVYLIKFEKQICYKFRYLAMRKVGIVREYLRVAMPVICNELLWGSGVAIIAIVIGRMGTEFTAANSICMVLSQLVMIAIYGVGSAAAVIVGNAVGEGRHDAVGQYAKTFIMLAIALGLASSCVVLLIKEPMLMVYNITDTARLYARQIMTIYAVIVPFQSMAMITLIGVLRGGGDTRFVLMGDLVFMWMLSIPLGFLTGLHLGWPVWAVYSVLKCDEIFKSFAALIRIFKGGWINDITKK